MLYYFILSKSLLGTVRIRNCSVLKDRVLCCLSNDYCVADVMAELIDYGITSKYVLKYLISNCAWELISVLGNYLVRNERPKLPDPLLNCPKNSLVLEVTPPHSNLALITTVITESLLKISVSNFRVSSVGNNYLRIKIIDRNTSMKLLRRIQELLIMKDLFTIIKCLSKDKLLSDLIIDELLKAIH